MAGKGCAAYLLRMAPLGSGRPVEERFWSKVDRNGPIPAHRPELGPCWLWTGAGAGGGRYGVFTGAKDECLSAHRVSWELAHGPVPPGLEVLHACDRKPCVRPDHLFLGTQLDNVRDCKAKGRRRKVHGAWCNFTRLTDAQVGEIRAALSSGSRGRDLAKQYGCSQGLISLIKHRRTRKAVA